MSKEIEVYNAYFGDCVMLKDKNDNSNLLIDFGIHFFSDVSSKYGSRSELTRKIADDIATRYLTGKTSLLITHFHEDHVSGLVYMYESKQKKYKGLFENIYVANIWNNPFAVASNLLEEILLEIQLKKSGLPRTIASLFDVMDFLRANISKIKLLSRGVMFENDKYIALWPKGDDRDNHISEVIHSLKLPTHIEGKLLALSEIACIYVRQEILGEGMHNENSDDNFEGYEKSIYENNNDNDRTKDMRIIYQSLLDEIFENVVDLEQGNLLDVQQTLLHRLNHKYNVVFQNNICGDDNLLFTGDAETEQMVEIATAKDIKLHQHYKFIKIPHHGTERHYFDFSKYTPESIIITNGKVNTSNSDSYKICGGYGKIKAVHICANSNNCCNCSAICKATKRCYMFGRKLVYCNLYESV